MQGLRDAATQCTSLYLVGVAADDCQNWHGGLMIVQSPPHHHLGCSNNMFRPPSPSPPPPLPVFPSLSYTPVCSRPGMPQCRAWGGVEEEAACGPDRRWAPGLWWDIGLVLGQDAAAVSCF